MSKAGRSYIDLVTIYWYIKFILNVTDTVTLSFEIHMSITFEFSPIC